MPEPRPSLAYRALANLAVPLASRLLRATDAHAGHVGRLAAPDALTGWARRGRDPQRPLVWFHAASVGEGLQARAVVAALQNHRPDLQVVVTRFSASALRIADQFDADHVGFVPYDRRDDVERAIVMLAPTLLVFTKVDVWPELATGAKRAGARTALVAGTVDPGSSRLRWPARAFTRAGYAVLDRVGAVSQLDAARLGTLGVAAGRTVVTGDPRVDSVLARAGQPTAGQRDPALLVAGSTWRADETILLSAFRAVREQHPDARLWLVPHAPSADAMASIAARIASLGLPPLHRGPSHEPISVIEEMGVLADLYGAGGMAYVGGGFGTRGVHSVLEPAAVGTPVIVGPHDRGVRDVSLLAGPGALVRLPRDRAEATLVDQWSNWLDRPAEALRCGAAGHRALQPDHGAAERSAELLLDLLPSAPPVG